MKTTIIAFPRLNADPVGRDKAQIGRVVVTQPGDNDVPTEMSTHPILADEV